MVGVPRTPFRDLVLLPITCIANGCRPSGRQSRRDAQRDEDRLQFPRGEIPIPLSIVQEPSVRGVQPAKPKAETINGLKQGAAGQSQCIFLSKVPAEVRVMIYRDVLCGPVPVVHVVRRKDGTLCHVRCRATEGECGTFRCYNDYSELSRTTKSGPAPIGKEYGPSGQLLSLASTCRKIYTEAIGILYNENTFSFFDLPVIDDFSSAVPQQHLNVVQRIQFEYKLYRTIRHFFPSLAPALGGTLTWGKVRQILSGMQGLHEIRVKVAKAPEAHGTPGMMPEVIRITDFVADRTDGASEAMRRLLEVENVEVIIEEVP